MSLHCPQCGGLVYARSNANCGHCGAALPPEFRFTEPEQGAEVERVLRLYRGHMRPPVLPALTPFLWRLIVVALCLYVIVHSSSWIYWLLVAALAIASFEDFYRYSKQKKLYTSTRDTEAAGVSQILRWNRSQIRPPGLLVLALLLSKVLATALCIYLAAISSYWICWLMAGTLVLGCFEDSHWYFTQKKLCTASRDAEPV